VGRDPSARVGMVALAASSNMSEEADASFQYSVCRRIPNYIEEIKRLGESNHIAAAIPYCKSSSNQCCGTRLGASFWAATGVGCASFRAAARSTQVTSFLARSCCSSPQTTYTHLLSLDSSCNALLLAASSALTQTHKVKHDDPLPVNTQASSSACETRRCLISLQHVEARHRRVYIGSARAARALHSPRFQGGSGLFDGSVFEVSWGVV